MWCFWLLCAGMLDLQSLLSDTATTFWDLQSHASNPALVANHRLVAVGTILSYEEAYRSCIEGGSTDLSAERQEVTDSLVWMYLGMTGTLDRERIQDHASALYAVLDWYEERILDCEEGFPMPDRFVDWVVAPNRYRRADQGSWEFSDEALQDVIGADHWSSSGRNRPSLFQRGDVIELEPGDFRHFRITLSTDRRPGVERVEQAADVVWGRDPQTTIRARLPGTVRILPNPVGGSQTLYFEWGGAFTFQDIIFTGDDMSALASERPASDRFSFHQGFRDLWFFDCHVEGGWNPLLGTGTTGKWGILNYEMGRSAEDAPGWVWKGGSMEGVFQEHFHYFHNVQGDVWIGGKGPHRPLRARWAGRTFFQMANRRGEGPAGYGNLTFRDIVVEDTCLEDGGGGSAFSFHGRHQGTILLERVKVRLGANPELPEPWNRNITGALVAFAGGDTGGAPNGDLVVRQCDFQVGPFYDGVGAARRANVEIRECRSFVLEATRIAQLGPDPRPALEIASDLITGSIVLDDDCVIVGRCVFDGVSYPNYASMLAAVEAHPKVHIR